MSAQEELASAVKTAFGAYTSARDELRVALGGVGRDELDGILSVAEEFGARHARTLIRNDPHRFGIEAEMAASDDLEHKLENCVEANYALDGAVAIQEQRRIEEGWPVEQRTIAFHGEFPVVDMTAMTITFPGRTPEPVTMREGRGPEPLEPAHGPTRTRSRGRSR
jgi:hypothetical protein